MLLLQLFNVYTRYFQLLLMAQIDTVENYLKV